MNAPNLKRSIVVIFILVALVILQHMVHLADMQQSSIALFVNTSAVLFTCIYFVQLSRNLEHFLFLSRIKYKAYMIAASYCVIHLTITWLTLHVQPPYQPGIVDKEMKIILLLAMIATYINLVVQYSILGSRLVKNAGFPFVKELGITFLYLLPFMLVAVLVFLLIKPLKSFAHIFIIIELLPYWFTYQLYQAIIEKRMPVAETQDLIITNAAAIRGEEENTAG